MRSFISYKIKISAIMFWLIFFLHIANAQDLQKAKHYWETKELAFAAEQIKGYTSSNNSDINGWLLKAKIYAAISDDAASKYLAADGRMEAYDALERSVKLDKVHCMQQLETDSFALPQHLYSGYINDGVAIFNAAVETKNKATYLEAFNTFKKVLIIGNFMYTNGIRVTATDNLVIFYLATTAIRTGKDEEAVFYIRKLVDAGTITGPEAASCEDLYKWLVYYYRTQNNAAALEKYTAIASTAFPAAEYFPKNYIDWLRLQKEYKKLFMAYENMFTKGFHSADNHYAYAVDLFSCLYGGNDSVANKPYYSEKLFKQLTAYTQQNPGSVKGKLLFAKFCINQSADLQKELAQHSAVAGNKILNTYKASIIEKINSANKYLLDIVNNFRTCDKKLYNEAVDLLVADYHSLNQPAQAQRHEKLYRTTF